MSSHCQSLNTDAIIQPDVETMSVYAVSIQWGNSTEEWAAACSVALLHASAHDNLFQNPESSLLTMS